MRIRLKTQKIGLVEQKSPVLVAGGMSMLVAQTPRDNLRYEQGVGCRGHPEGVRSHNTNQRRIPGLGSGNQLPTSFE